MRLFHIILLLFLSVPLLELYLLLRVGSLIGAVPTLLIVVVTAIVGAWLLRMQGISTLRRFQQHLSAGQMPAQEMIEGPILMLGGILLLTPGLITDALGFACLIPQSRKRIVHFMMDKKMYVVAATMRQEKNGHRRQNSDNGRTVRGEIIEGEFREEKDR